MTQSRTVKRETRVGGCRQTQSKRDWGGGGGGGYVGIVVGGGEEREKDRDR